MTPREVIERLIDGICRGDLAELPGLYAEDAVVEHVFGVTEPFRWEGAAQVREHFGSAGTSGLRMTAHDLVVHETTDPEVVVAEWVYEGTTGAGNEFRAANLIVARVRAGKIVSSRDYHDHARMAAAMGRLPELTGALGG
ncbi:nuclear transport factor 2 family protein [Sciscionella marina]|uniref:nuclear transport factor 2 family protein n=1 Tax=Sciscionella marina TaxID=508770 RepID=UPI000360997B|nr:nuclear transport factor 2 family protein [Sciscionella marina]